MRSGAQAAGVCPVTMTTGRNAAIRLIQRYTNGLVNSNVFSLTLRLGIIVDI
jgi:hypothetical protein